MFTDPWQSSQGRSTWSDGQSEHGYMRLANKRKLVRIRQTVYEDPGNPFADEMEEADEAPPASWFSHDKSLPPRPFRTEPGDEVDDVDEAPPDSWFSHSKPLPPRPCESEAEDHASLRSNSEYDERRVQSVPPNDPVTFADPALRLKLPHQNSSAAVKVNHRRSKSVALFAPSPTDTNAEYISPRRFWRPGSVPAVQPKGPISSDGQDVRDTRFYGFYDDIMRGYKNRDSRM